MVRFHEPDDGRTAERRVNQEFEICLPENPTAGFRWRIVQGGEPVCALLDEAFEPGRAAPGQPGVHTWRFTVVAQGTATIALAYRRAWESAPTAARTFALRVTGTK